MDCPICFESFTDPSMILKTHCMHQFCSLCLLEFYLKSSLQNDYRSHFHCPVCRKSNNLCSIFKTEDRWELNGTLKVRKDVKLIDLDNDAINNLIYCQSDNILNKSCVGLASYHFNTIQPNHDEIDNGDTPKESYISYKNAPGTWKLDNGNPFPREKYFTNYSYDKTKQEFHGIVDWRDTPVFNATQWVYRMKFSDDFAKIESGECKSYNADGNLLDTVTFGKDLHYKLDVQAIIRQTICKTKEARNLCAVCSKELLEESCDEESKMSITKDEKVVKTSECGHKFCLSCVLHWLRNETDTVKYHFMNIGYGACNCPLCDHAIDLFSITMSNNDKHQQNNGNNLETPLIERPQNTVDGLIFSQGYPGPNAEGVASYHFHIPTIHDEMEDDDNGTDGSYISYKNAPATWKLDNGEPFPAKKYFANVSYDATENEFNGEISWKDTPVNNGVTKWVYRMKFSSNGEGSSGNTAFMFIHSGECCMYDDSGELVSKHKFGEDLRYHLDVYAMLKLRYSLK